MFEFGALNADPEGGPLALATLLLLPVIPFILLTLLKGVSGHRAHGFLLAIAVVFVLSCYFRSRGYEEKDIDYQVALRLGALVVMFAMSFMLVRKMISVVNPWGLGCWLCFLGYTVLTSSYAVSPTYAFVATSSLLVGFVFVCCLCVHYGPDRAAAVFGVVYTLAALVSLIIYFVDPGFGRESAWFGNEYLSTWRLKGLFGSSNGAGLSSAVGLFVIVALQQSGGATGRVIKYVGAASAAACLILSNNRMALVALVAAAATVYVLSGRIARKTLFVLAAIVIVASCAALFADDIMAMAARSGNEAEIMTLTGRTRIWPVVIQLWLETPLFGRGFSSSLYILPTHPDLFLAAASAHSLYLEQLFSGGLMALGLLLLSIIVTFWLGWKRGASRELGLLIFFIIYGVTEPIINGPVSFPVFIMFLAAARIISPATETVSTLERFGRHDRGVGWRRGQVAASPRTG